jgi:hypothetical protein
VLEGLPESAWTVKLLVPEVVNGRFQFAYFGEHSRDLLPDDLLGILPQQDGEDFHYLQILRLFPGLGGSSDLGSEGLVSLARENVGFPDRMPREELEADRIL